MSELPFDLRKPQTWPDEVGFVPFIGSRYEEGIDGLRVLILGESHYADEKALRLDSTGKRNYTRVVFRGVDDETVRDRAWGTFFRRCDTIVSRTERPTDLQAALGWQRVAFANLVQDFVGDAARQRPSREHWREARAVFPRLMEKLEPDVILVLGKALWNHTPNDGTRIGAIAAPRMERAVWRMNYPGGSALMSWVYHPSWPNDSAATYVHVMQSLLRLAREEQANTEQAAGV